MSFLWHCTWLVRIMVGTLLEVGCGRMTAEQVRTVLENPDRQKAGPTALAKGTRT